MVCPPLPGEPKLWPYYMQWGGGYPSFHGQHLLKTDCTLRLAGVARFVKMQDLDLLLFAARNEPRPGAGGQPLGSQRLEAGEQRGAGDTSLVRAVEAAFASHASTAGPIADALEVRSRLWFPADGRGRGQLTDVRMHKLNLTTQMGHSISRPELVAVDWTHRPVTCLPQGTAPLSQV